MKKLKQMISSTICAVVTGILILTGCGSSDKYQDSSYVGTWNAQSASYMGMEFEVEEILGGEFFIRLEANGNATANIVGNSEEGSWEPTENGILVKDSTDELEFIYDNDNLILDYDNVTIVFSKE